MNKTFAIGLSVVGVMVSSAAWAEGRPAPDWCKVKGRLSQRDVKGLRDIVDPGKMIEAIAYLECNPKEVATGDIPELDEAYRKLSKRLELTDAEWSEAMQWAVVKDHSLDLDVTDQRAKWSTLAPSDQYTAIQKQTIEVPGLSGGPDAAYVADAFGPHLSELGRLGYMVACLKGNSDVELAMCQPDLDAFDMGKITAEIRADASDATVRMTFRLLADSVREQIPARRELVKKLMAKDAAYAKMFEIAAATRKEWDARWRDRPDLIALALEIDDAMVSHSRKATEGCREKTWNALKAEVAKLPAKAFMTRNTHKDEFGYIQDVMLHVAQTIVADSNGYLAASAYTMCEKLDEKGPHGNLAAWLTEVLGNWAGFRGPRSATYTAILTAGLELDDSKARIHYPQVSRFWFGRAGADSGGDVATMDSVKISGEEATIVFAQKLESRTVDTGCTRTNHVVGIRSDGSFDYQWNCTGSTQVTSDRKQGPATVLARYVAGLKGGMTIAYNRNIVWMAWPKAGVTVPSYVLGQPVK